MTSTLSAAALNFILHYLKNKKVDIDLISKKLDINTSLFNDPDARVPLKTIQSVWKEAVELSGDDTLPLYLGKDVSPFSIGVLAYMLMHCNTIGTALEKLCHYQDVVCEGVATTLEATEDKAIVKLKIIDEDIIHPAFTIESELSVYLTFLSAMLGQTFPLEEVHFNYPAPADTARHSEVFNNSELVFGSDFNGLVFSKSVLKAPVINANPNLFPMFEKHVEECYFKLKKTNTLTFKIKEQILGNLKGEEPKLAAISREMAMSTRSIQMKLKEEGITFRQLLDEIRKDIAVSYLKDDKISTTDLSFLLGFSEPSVFHRSFKKWTGITPAAFRKNPVTI